MAGSLLVPLHESVAAPPGKQQRFRWASSPTCGFWRPCQPGASPPRLALRLGDRVAPQFQAAFHLRAGSSAEPTSPRAQRSGAERLPETIPYPEPAESEALSELESTFRSLGPPKVSKANNINLARHLT